MEWFHLREPVSAWSHAAGLLLAVPATIMLLRCSDGNRLKQIGFLIFGLTLFACYGGSTLYHGAHGSPARLAWLDTLDHVGIYLLIAGTMTPVVLVVLEGCWRLGMLVAAWLLAASGIALTLTFQDLPLLVTTALYLAMGWGILTCYFELARVLSPRAMNLALLGGLFYTAGAFLNVAGWPTPWPGIVGPHEVFHAFVLAGSAAHVLFARTVVAPYERPAAVAVPARPALVPVPAQAAAARLVIPT
jgi:hemolysin III